MPAFDALPAQQPEVSAVPAAGATQGPPLLIDQFLPRYDFAVVHAQVFGIPAVIAMQFAVSDHAAIEFAPALYGAVTTGRPIDAAGRADAAAASVDADPK
jgi:hypothetical protein